MAVALAQSPGQPTSAPTDAAAPELLKLRAVIESPTGSETTRLAGAEELLLSHLPAAGDLIAGLLDTSSDPSVRVVMCRAIERVQANQTGTCEPRMVELLIKLLADPNPTVPPAASAALSTFHDEAVVRRVGEVVRDAVRPLEQRLAAVDALSPSIEFRAAVAQLIDLLNLEEGPVRERVWAALALASRVNYGRNPEAWEAWWREKAALDDAAWLEDRVRLLGQRSRDLQLRLETVQRESDTRYKALSRRLGDALRLNYRLTAQDAQRDELLVAWLRDPSIDFRRAALDLVKEQVYEQRRPSEAIRVALRELYADSSPDLRREVLELVAALNDPADMEPIRARLEVENDLSVRETILGVLGKLRNPAAIPVLIGEVADTAAAPSCVIKAAQSLATLTRENADAALVERAVAPLRARLANAKPDDLRLRGALLGAMAGIGSSEFTPEFESGLGQEQADLLLPAIRGIVAVQDRGQLVRLRTLCGHSDAAVRLQAMEAVGVLGEGDGSLEVLAGHLNAAVEPNEAVRTAAWNAFGKLLKREPAENRLKWAARLKDVPARQIEYLSGLVDDFSAASPVPPQIDEARELLVRLLRAQARYAECVRHLQEIHAAAVARGDARAGESGLLLLDAMLRGGQTGERLDQLLAELAKLGADTQTGVTRTVTAYLDEAVQRNDDPGLAAVLQRLRHACEGRFGAPFDEYLHGIARQLVPTTTSSRPATS